MNRIFLLVLLGILITFLVLRFPYSISGTDNKMHLLYLLVLLSAFAVSARSFTLNQTIKYTSTWVAIILFIIVGYSYKDEIMDSRVMRELMPNQARITGDGNIAIRAGENGHFYVEALVNGVAVNFMIDTGASDLLLSKEDAIRAGIPMHSLSFTRIYNTANGTTTGAGVTINSIKIGNFTLNNFPASVNGGKMDNSLLGMSALRKLGGFRVEGNTMIIGNMTNNYDDSQ